MAEDNVERQVVPVNRRHDGDDSACGAVAAPERTDDPLPSLRVRQMNEAYEEALIHVYTDATEESARSAVESFREAAERLAQDESERAHARRLVVSARLSLLLHLGGDVEEAAMLANELVALPCHRRMNQLREVIIFAHYALDHGRPEAAWEPLMKALGVIESEIPEHEAWRADRDAFRDVVKQLWDAIPPPKRRGLSEYRPIA